MYIQAYKTSNLRMKIAKNDFPSRPLYLEGALTRSAHYQQYQPVVTLRKGYTIHWDQTAPAELAIWLINFNKCVGARQQGWSGAGCPGSSRSGDMMPRPTVPGRPLREPQVSPCRPMKGCAP